MANGEKVSVALTPEMAAMMREMVEAGEYASASEVMREALRDRKHRRAQRAEAIAALGPWWDAGMGSGPAVDGEEACADQAEARCRDPRAWSRISYRLRPRAEADIEAMTLYIAEDNPSAARRWYDNILPSMSADRRDVRERRPQTGGTD